MRILRDFWMEFEGIVDFFDRNGESIDDMDFPLKTKVLEEKETSSGYWQVVLDVVAEPDSKENKNKNVEDIEELRNLLWEKVISSNPQRKRYSHQEQPNENYFEKKNDYLDGTMEY